MDKIQIKVRLMGLMKKISLTILLLVTFFLFSNNLIAQSNVVDVATFNKIVVSPHIEVLFKEGDKESVNVEFITVPIEKLHIVVENNTLSLYLEGAKISSKKNKVKINDKTSKKPIYKGTVAKVVITYKKINSLDLRGKERLVFENNIVAEKLNLKIYGDSQVYMNEVDIQDLQVSIFGESYLELQQGKTENQKFTAYGESKVNALNIENKETRLTAYGDGTFQFNVLENLKITSYGEAVINYTGKPEVQKGLVIGKTKITNVNF